MGKSPESAAVNSNFCLKISPSVHSLLDDIFDSNAADSVDVILKTRDSNVVGEEN